MREYIISAITKEPKIRKGDLTVSEFDFQDINFKVILQKYEPVTMLPVVKTDYRISFETKEISEWENVNNLEAIVSGSGKATFGLSFFATDYAENREIYVSKKDLELHVSGIAFVLDIHRGGKVTAYLPNMNILPNYACFDFIGILLDFRESNLLDGNKLEGYLMNIKLITYEGIEDFFNIDMFVAKENMRFSELQKGMYLSGMFQLQGRIAK